MTKPPYIASQDEAPAAAGSKPVKPFSRGELLAFLDNQQIAHKTHDHAPVFTVAQSAHIKSALPGGHTKNLFLMDKDGQAFLLCALGQTKIPVNRLHRHLSCRRLSFGKPDDLLEHLGVTPGSVTLFALLNDRQGRVQLILDKNLFDHAIVNFHPMRNDATTAIASQDMIRFAKAAGHVPRIMDFSEL